MKKPHILVISYLFPPMGGIAVQRALSLVKYLPDCGFEVHVLTAKNAAGPVYDPALLKNVPPSVQIHNTFTPEVPFRLRQRIWKWMDRSPNRAPGQQSSPTPAKSTSGVKSFPISLVQRVLCPEPEVAWVPFALRAARRVVKQYEIDCVLVTAPPFSAFLIGNALRRENSGLSLVSDFRDEWLTFYLSNNEYQNNPYARRRAPRIERETIELSDLVVAVNRSSLQEIRRRYPDQPEAKFACVPNGYDSDVFASFTPRPHGQSYTLVTHVGTVYRNSSPKYYLEALKGLPEAVRARIKTRFVGRTADEERAWLVDWPGPFESHDFLPQAEALRFMEETDFLLLTMTDPISMPGKLYEYAATGKPVIAFAPAASEVYRFFQETGIGWCLDPADNIGNARFLQQLFADTGPIRPAHSATSVTVYNRANLAREYAAQIRATMALST